MRTLSILAILLLCSAILKAQLKNTQWKGKMYVPSETKVILDFKEDSVDMIMVDFNGMVGETMTYSIKDSVITMKKTSGNSPCNVGDEFKVKYLIQDDKLFISNLSDPCDDRIHAWSNEALIRVNE